MPTRFLSPDSANWRGRKAPAGDYWYQKIECLEWPAYLEPTRPGVGILGYAVDEGVSRNQGRVGAAAGPLAIRRQLASLANHLPAARALYDLGDITCPDNDLESSQAALANCVKEILRQGDFPVLLGGGHDVAYAHYRGVSQNFPNKRIGFVNFDAHFDLRPDDQGPSSGTPFYQLFREARAAQTHFSYLPLGIQLAASPPSLLKTAKEFGVDFKVAGEITFNSTAENIEYLDAFLAELDGICLTIDLDGFASAYAPGVSAPSALGFSPRAVFPLIDHLAKSGKLISLDVAELNPTYDQDNITAKLAARCIETVVRNLP